MHSYELRVITPGSRYPSIYASSHISDFAAIRRAVNLADGDEFIEVWRGTVCVYSGNPEDTSAL
jgi:hypothetical protein